MKKLLVSLLLAALSLAGQTFAQDAGGASTIRFGSALPSGVPEWRFFTLTDGTGLYQCQHSPTCTNAGQWVVIGGAGGTCSGTCANLALSNLTTTAIAIPLMSAAGIALNLETPNDGASAAPNINILPGNGGALGPGGTVFITGGPADNSGTHPGGNVIITSGSALTGSGNTNSGIVAIATGSAINGTTQNSGLISLITGGASNLAGGITLQTGNSPLGPQNITITGGNATYSGGACGGCFGGSVYVYTGNGTAGTPGLFQVATGIASGVGGAINLYSGNNSNPGSMNINLGGGTSTPGRLHWQGGIFYYDADNTFDFDSSTNRPRNAYFGGNVVAGGNLTGSGSATLTGAITGNSVSTSGSGPFQFQGSYGTLAVSSAGKTRFGFGPLGPEFSYNGGALTYFASLDGSGNVAQNANSATKLATAGTACAGAFATGVDAFGNALCNTATYIQLPWQTCGSVTPVSGYGIICFDQPSGTMEFSLNGSGFTQFVHPNLFNWNAPSGANPDYLEQRDATTPQHFCVFNTYTDATHYERNCFGYDTTTARWQLWSDAGSAGGGSHPLEITLGFTTAWVFDNVSGFAIRPTTTNLYDIGSASFAVRNIYAGTGIYMAAGTADGCLTAVSRVITPTGTPCGSGGGGMVWPGAGIGNSTGSAWGTSYSTSGTGTVVALTASPTLTGTLNGAAAIFSGNVTIGGSLIMSGSGANEVISTLNSTSCTTPGAGSSGYCFDTTANGGVLNIYENGAAGYGLTAAIAAKVATSTTVNGHALSSNVVVSATDLTTGTLPAARLPVPTASTLGGVESIVAVGSQWVAYIDTSGVAHLTQPAFTDISGSVTGAQLPNPSASTLGGIQSIVAVSHKWIDSISTSGVAHQAQPASTDLSDTVPTTGTLVNGNYVSASGAKALQDSTVVAGPYTCAWLTYPTLGSGAPTTGGTANKASLWGVNLSEPCTTTKITYDIITGDTSGGTYDIGIVAAQTIGSVTAGTVVAHIGNTAASTSFTATGLHTVNWTGTSVLQPGKYYLAITCSATTLCATFGGASSNGVTFLSNTTASVSSGGTLSTITPPADSMSYGSAIPVWIIQ